MNISGLASAQNAALTLSNLILVTPNTNPLYQAQSAPLTGRGTTPLITETFLFHYEGEQVLTLESDITDHYIEDNTAIQDQIALRPEMYTTHGFIGELNDVVPPLLEPLKFVADKLTVVGAYTPGLSQTAILAYNQAFQTYQTATTLVNNAVNAWNSINNGSQNQTKQQLYYTKLQGYWRNRTLFTIQTPWATFNNMAIKTLRAIQDAETRVITDFELTFKKVNFATTLLFSPIRQGRLGAQGATETNNGTFAAAPAGETLAQKLAGVTA